ncbi:hypothetical protein HMPREF1866_01548 [Lachnoanaerobaculum saburreum]|uniref:Uncharacterized protein n=1 Tax=Lachnoanaerobaculum saburreum TaxID=467210 RepID=A0A133ZNY1_9FIRM|nr:hypothetical protein HMPREF1866_01548 [Lachnoanaerobaculum saburreum]
MHIIQSLKNAQNFPSFSLIISYSMQYYTYTFSNTCILYIFLHIFLRGLILSYKNNIFNTNNIKFIFRSYLTCLKSYSPTLLYFTNSSLD